VSPTPLRLTLALSLLTQGLVSACVTAPAIAGPSASTMPAPDPELVMLRERVARLEKRLAETDGKLALLLARAETAPPSSVAAAAPRLRADRPRDAVAWDLNPPRASASTGDSGGEGVRSIDLERSRPDEAIDDDGATLRLPGDDAPLVEAANDNNDVADDNDVADVADDNDDPLGALNSAQDLYAWGQGRMKENRFIEALAAFEDVLGRFPKHGLADNSLYWIGACHHARGEHRLAIAEWQKLPARFPKSPKVPDALFGMAQSHEAIGEPAVAEVLYDEVVASYPGAEKHPDAKKALGRLRPAR
jgi:tol-pal system protein YbgF